MNRAWHPWAAVVALVASLGALADRPAWADARSMQLVTIRVAPSLSLTVQTSPEFLPATWNQDPAGGWQPVVMTAWSNSPGTTLLTHPSGKHLVARALAPDATTETSLRLRLSPQVEPVAPPPMASLIRIIGASGRRGPFQLVLAEAWRPQSAQPGTVRYSLAAP